MFDCSRNRIPGNPILPYYMIKKGSRFRLPFEWEF